jgi:hypothetical protein
MDNLTVEQLPFAVATLENLVNARGPYLNTARAPRRRQTIGDFKGPDPAQADPSPEVLVKPFKALGLKLDDILHDAPIAGVNELLGYLATPLTAVVTSAGQNADLERIVAVLHRSRAYTFAFVVIFCATKLRRRPGERDRAG